MNREQFCDLIARSSGSAVLGASARWVQLDYAAGEGYRRLSDATGRRPNEFDHTELELPRAYSRKR
jgi:hypothetical protein